MAQIDIFSLEGEKVSERDIKDEIFSAPVRADLAQQAVRGQLASCRGGNACTKNRADVCASGSKLYRQKGTGRARSGAASSPLRRGGGVIFGPLPRKFSFKINKKIKRAALKSVLADKYQTGRMVVVDHFELDEVKTKKLVGILKNLNIENALIVTGKPDLKLEKSTRNIQGVKLLRAEGLNVYDVLNHDHILFIEPALTAVEEALGK